MRRGRKARLEKPPVASAIKASMTDAKVPDNQAGYEKGIAVALAALAGCNNVSESAGMMGSLMAFSPESLVIDNDMLGSIMKSLSGIEVSEETLALNTIDEVVHGDGHFLGQPETLQRMQTDFVYPEIGDRRTIDEWEDDGSKDIREVARERTRQILKQHYPRHISSELDRKLRDNFDIRLPETVMEQQ